MSDTFRILLPRHGESKGNVDPLYYGFGDPDNGLTEEGWRQGFKLNNFIESFYKENPMDGRDYPQTIDTSPWIRAVQTEEAGTQCFRGNPHIIFHRDEALREQSFGLLYRTHTRCDPDLTKLLNDAAEAYKKNPFEAVPPQGDSPKMHYERVLPFVQRMREEMVSKNMRDRLIFGHSATNRHIATIMMGLPPQAWKDFQKPGNCDVWLLEDKGSGVTLKKIYDGVSGQRVDHNPAKTSFSFALAP